MTRRHGSPINSNMKWISNNNSHRWAPILTKVSVKFKTRALLRVINSFRWLLLQGDSVALKDRHLTWGDVAVTSSIHPRLWTDTNSSKIQSLIISSPPIQIRAWCNNKILKLVLVKQHQVAATYQASWQLSKKVAINSRLSSLKTPKSPIQRWTQVTLRSLALIFCPIPQTSSSTDLARLILWQSTLQFQIR